LKTISASLTVPRRFAKSAAAFSSTAAASSRKRARVSMSRARPTGESRDVLVASSNEP
jgi:hypothetical protein